MRRLRLIIIIGVLLISANLLKGQESIKWYTIEQAEELAKTNPRPIFMDVYTSWCGWCKHLDKTTFKDPQIVSYLNNNFYPVKYDAESNDTITHRGKSYINKYIGKTRRPTHDLSIELFKGNRMSYPTMFLFDSKFENKHPIQGYMEAFKLSPFLVFYKEQQYGNNVNPQEFAYYFLNTHQGDTTKRFTGETKINWMTMDEAFKAVQKDSSRKVFIQVEHQYCETCKVMDSTDFKSPIIAEILNKYYYPVKFDALSKEEFYVGKQKFINTENNGTPIHDFVLSIVPKGQTFSFPITLIFPNDHTLLDRAPRYMSPESMKFFLNHYKGDPKPAEVTDSSVEEVSKEKSENLDKKTKKKKKKSKPESKTKENSEPKSKKEVKK